MMDFHRNTIRKFEDYFFEQGESMFNETVNMLNGIWDGFLYDELISEMTSDRFPIELRARVFWTQHIIEKSLKSK